MSQCREGSRHVDSGAFSALWHSCPSMLVALLLSACGGGGSSSPTPPPPAPTISITGVTVAGVKLDGSTIDPSSGVTVAFTKDAGVGDVTISATATCPSATSGAVTTDQSAKTASVTALHLTRGTTGCTLVVQASASGVASVTSTSTFATSLGVVPAHGEMVLAINSIRFDFTIPLLIADASGAYVASNQTGFPSSPDTIDPIRLCAAVVRDDPAALEYTAVPTPEGFVITECQARYAPLVNGDIPRYRFLLDPVTRELLGKYNGAIPQGTKLVNIGDVDTPSASYPAPVNSFLGMNAMLGANLIFMSDTLVGLQVTTDFTSFKQLDDQPVKLVVRIPQKP